MRADNTRHLIESARKRRQDTLSRAQQVLHRAAQRGKPVTVTALAAEAGVSRSWLYAEPSLRPQLDALLVTPRHRPADRPAGEHRASDASLRTRLDLALARSKRLEQDNERLRDQLAHALGQQRHARVTGAAQ